VLLTHTSVPELDVRALLIHIAHNAQHQRVSITEAIFFLHFHIFEIQARHFHIHARSPYSDSEANVQASAVAGFVSGLFACAAADHDTPALEPHLVYPAVVSSIDFDSVHDQGSFREMWND
jgi:hypothetical protein